MPWYIFKENILRILRPYGTVTRLTAADDRPANNKGIREQAGQSPWKK